MHSLQIEAFCTIDRYCIQNHAAPYEFAADELPLIHVPPEQGKKSPASWCAHRRSFFETMIRDEHNLIGVCSFARHFRT
jgi:hypothetical protein